MANDDRERVVDLVAIAQRRLPPEDQRRLSELRAWQEERPLTPGEHAELLAYVERVEREDAERAEALLELSRLRVTQKVTAESWVADEPELADQIEALTAEIRARGRVRNPMS